MVEMIGELIRRWECSTDSLDIAGKMNALTLEVIARAGFGHRFVRLDDPSTDRTSRLSR
ncbi:hypothetical protein [Nocardia goodfellowii]|uniref:Uncharacterized protein n=1 Tax=Nocardia goodfellowii TaxID=882446 RepID=A0ABS4QPJ5_9NOCA|nr:hypothetical protein [Nocardia goodfellowii]MBP2193642.1 hypothetical protein [Nocardia goodfellowii]